MRVDVQIAQTWNGEPVPPVATVSVVVEGDVLVVEVDAVDHGDPPPDGPPGPTDALWEHEVVEVFLLGDEARYLEIELGPHGHHLVLELAGRRQIVRSGMTIAYTASRAGGRWRGRAELPAAWLPPGLSHLNAYAIHGVGAARRYLAWTPVPGDAPDFHRLECFSPVRLSDTA